MWIRLDYGDPAVPSVAFFSHIRNPFDFLVRSSRELFDVLHARIRFTHA